jgi:phenylalanyl-tRNA synthetase beta chain
MTASITPPEWSEAFSPWSHESPLISQWPMKGILADAPKELSPADRVRRSMIPSLLEARRYNESLSNPQIELFETARVYLPGKAPLPTEQPTLAMVSGQDYLFVKGVVEQLLETLSPRARLEILPLKHPLFDDQKACELRVAGRLLGFLGEISPAGQKQFGLRQPVTCAELSLTPLNEMAVLIPQHVPLSPYPSMARDLNLIVDEDVRWADLVSTVHSTAGDVLESVTYQETYRDPQRDGAGKKRLLFSFSLRSHKQTLTGEQADAIRDQIVSACADQHGAKLLA